MNREDAIEQALYEAGGDALPPALQAAVRRVMRRMSGAPTALLSHPRSRPLTVTSGGVPTNTLSVDVPFLLWGLKADFWSDDPNDFSGLNQLEISLPSRQAIVGDRTYGLSLAALVEPQNPVPLHPPILVLPGQELTIKGTFGTLAGTIMGCAVHFFGVDILGGGAYQ